MKQSTDSRWFYVLQCNVINSNYCIKTSSYIGRIFQASFNVTVKKCEHLKKAYFKSRRRIYLNCSPNMFQIEVFFNSLEVSLQNNKNFSVEINSKPKNCVGCIIGFLSRPLLNKEVIGSIKANLGDFLRPNIYQKIEMKVIFTDRFSLT